MCELYSLNQVTDLKEVECFCSLMYHKLGQSHNFSATVSATNNDYQINQCAEKVFSSIDTKNIYMHIAQKYANIQHNRFGCSVRSFVTILGCMLHHLITLLEENLSRRNIVQGIQESFEILCHLYRKSAIPVDEQVSFSIEKKTGEYLLSRINRYIMGQIHGNEDESKNDSYTVYIKSCTERLCHYDDLNMKETLWTLVQGFFMPTDDKDLLPYSPLKTEVINPIKSIGAMLSETFNPSGALKDMSFRVKNFKESNKNLSNLVCTQPTIDNGNAFSINSGILLTIRPDTTAVLNRFVGLRNCLMFDCDILETNMSKLFTFNVESNENPSSSSFGKFGWKSKFIDKIKAAQVNCIILSGTCDVSLKNELQMNMEISVIEGVPRKSLELVAIIMDVNINDEKLSTYTVCQLLITVLPLTTLDHLILCSLQIPKWMEIFGVTYVNLKTVLVRHPSLKIAQAMFESFKHNLRRIENALSMGYFLIGGGTLEAGFGKELKARANNKIINNTESEPIEQKCRTMLAVTKGLELYHFHLQNNIFNCEPAEDTDTRGRLDDLESKIGCIELLSQCLTTLFSTEKFIYSSKVKNSLPII